MTGSAELKAFVENFEADGSFPYFLVHSGDDDHLMIKLKRTVKVEDTSDSSYLPPDLGDLPLFNIADLSGLPEELQHGSMLTPIHGKS